MKHPKTLITLKPYYSLQGDGVSIAIANTHLHTLNSDCRTFNDYQTFNTTYTRLKTRTCIKYYSKATSAITLINSMMVTVYCNTFTSMIMRQSLLHLHLQLFHKTTSSTSIEYFVFEALNILCLLTSTDFILISLTMAYGIGRNIALERNKADFLQAASRCASAPCARRRGGNKQRTG